MKKIFLFLLLFPLISFCQTFKGFTILNQGKGIVTAGTTVSITSNFANNVVYFLGKDTLTSEKADSLILIVKSNGKKAFAATLNVVIGARNSLVNVAVKSPSTDTERIAIPITSFGVKQFNSVKFYITSIDKAGWEIIDLYFKPKYSPPIVISPGTPKPDTLQKNIKVSYYFRGIGKMDISGPIKGIIDSLFNRVDTIDFKIKN